MRKITILFALISTLFISSFAQTSVCTNYGIQDNWFIGAQVGAKYQFNDATLLKEPVKFDNQLFLPEFSLYVGKYFTPYVGARLSVTGFNKAYHFGTLQASAKFYAIKPTIDGLVDWTNLIGGFDTNREWSFNTVTGIGYETHLGSNADGYFNVNRLFLNLGVQTLFDLSDNFALGLELRTRFYNDANDGLVGYYKRPTILGTKFDTDVAAVATLQYNFGKQFGEEVMYNQASIDEMNEQLNALHEAHRKALNEKQIVEVERIIEVIKVEKEYFFSEQAVQFKIGDAEIEESQLANLELVADALKTLPKDEYIIELYGYGDAQTGSVKRNLQLATERAENVMYSLQNELVKQEFKLIPVGSKEQRFHRNNLNRVVVIKVVKK